MIKYFWPLILVSVFSGIAIAEGYIDAHLEHIQAKRDSFFKRYGEGKSDTFYLENCPKEFVFLKEVSNKNVIAKSLLAGCYAFGMGDAKDEVIAFELFSEAATEEDAYAQLSLGHIYKNGVGVSKDNDQALKWFLKSADQGYFLAQSRLAFMYATGNIVPKNETLAVLWFRKAAQQQDAIAQYNLAVAYFTGRGVVQSDNIAMEWLCKASEQGLLHAQDFLKKLTRHHSSFHCNE